MEKPFSQGYEFRRGADRDDVRSGEGEQTGGTVSFTQHILELIDTRSFSNMWYWIALAVLWSSTSHYGLGIPFDMLQRARRKGGQAQEDLEDLVRINCGRILYIGSISGLWIVGLDAFLLTGLALLGFVYDIEVAQAVFLIVFPLSVIGALSLSTAQLIRDKELHGEELRDRLMRHRFWIQVIGLISIFVTAMWGMYQNIHIGGPFG